MKLEALADYSHLRLEDGRRLAFTEGGAPDGFPVFHFHGTPSSRLEAAFADDAATRSGFRLIATDRPGFGQSDFQHDRTLQSWPRNVLALADCLQIEEFGVAGHSGGGAYLFACGAAQDAYLAYSDWGFDIADTRVPIHMWIGDDDIFVTKAMGRYIEGTVPQIETHWIPGAGHLCFGAWTDIFAACQSEMTR